MISLRIDGIDRVLLRIQRLQLKVAKGNHEILERLAQVGIDTAGVKFSTAQYDGMNDVQMLEPEWVDENTVRVVASGEAVAFIEFGTGVHYTEQHPLAGEVGAVRGGYGHHLGRLDSWFYTGDPGTDGELGYHGDRAVVITHGNPPARAMYDAAKEMRDKILEIVREVYRQ